MLSRAGRGYTKPGPGAQVDWGSDLANNLIMCILINEGLSAVPSGGARLRDLCGSRHGYIPFAAAGNIHPGQKGIVWNSAETGANARVDFGGVDGGGITTADGFVIGGGIPLPTQHCTIMMGYRKTDVTNRASCPFGTDDAADAGRVQAHVPYSDGVVYWDFGGNAGPNRTSKTGLTFGDDIWAFTAGQRSGEIWQNGFRQAVNGSATPATRSNTAGKKFIFSQGVGTAAGDLAEYLFFYMWARQLSIEEIQYISREPYAHIKSGVSRSFFSLAASAAAAHVPGIINNPLGF